MLKRKEADARLQCASKMSLSKKKGASFSPADRAQLSGKSGLTCRVVLLDGSLFPVPVDVSGEKYCSGL